jgi:hypothetical protein
MMRAGTRRAAVFCLVLMLMPIASAGGSDDAPMVLIDQSQGEIVFGELNLTGLYIDEREPSALTWRLFDGFDLIDSGNLMDSLPTASDTQESSRSTWAWSLNLDFSEHRPCACIVEITALDDTEQSAVAWLIIFASDDSVDLPPQVLIEGPSWTDLLSGLIVMRGFAMDDDHAPPTVQWALTDDASVSMACMQPRIDPPETFTWNNATSNWLDGAFQIPVDTTQYDDGAYVLVVRAVAEDGSTSPSACVPVGLDNHPPEAHITGPVLIEESEAMLSFDGSGSSDAFWGREELVFLWILEEIDGAPEDRLIQSGRDLRTLEVAASEAGAYSLTLTVADSGGFSDTATHLFDITNLAPSAALRIDGQPLVDGDLITLAEGDQWWLDCGGSTDTPNDEPGLTCTWFIDGEPVMTGWERQLMRPEDVSTTHTLTLLVTDDDGANDSISITFGIQGTGSDPMRAEGDSSVLPDWAQLLLGAALITGIIAAGMLVSRRHDSSGGIPKWKRKAAKRQDPFAADAPFDQTDDVVDDSEDL